MPLIPLSLLAAAALAATSPTTAPAPDRLAATPRTLRVTGEGRVTAPPDLATVTFAAVAVDPSLAKATRDANDRARRLLEAVAAAGVPAADVQTSRYDVQLERDSDRPQDPPRIRGYRVTNAVAVKVRDLSRLGGLLDRAVSAGANEVDGPAFARADPAPDQQRALSAAVRSARAKAEEMARAAGIELGELLEVREERAWQPGPIPAVRAMASAMEVPLAQGVLAFEARVELVFAVR